MSNNLTSACQRRPFAPVPLRFVLWRWVLLCMAVAMLPGCAGLGIDSATTSILTEGIDSSRAEVRTVTLRRRDGELVVFGRLHKRQRGRSPIPGHLHIEAFGSDGQLLLEETAAYRQLNPKMGLSEYAVILPVSAENVQRVRVTHHQEEGGNA